MADIPKDVLDHTVTLFETSPRDRWRGEATKLANHAEKIYSTSLDETTTGQLVELNESFNKSMSEVQVAFDAFTSECLDKEKTDLEKRLAGHSHVSALTTFYIQYRLDYFKKKNKEITAALNQQHQQLTALLRRTYADLRREKWKHAKVREAFIDAVCAMKHGGEIGPLLIAHKDYLEKVRQEIMDGMSEKANAIMAETDKKTKDSPWYTELTMRIKA